MRSLPAHSIPPKTAAVIHCQLTRIRQTGSTARVRSGVFHLTAAFESNRLFVGRYPCIPIVPGICENTCLFAICVDPGVIGEAIAAIGEAAEAVAEAVSEHVDNWARGVSASARETAGYAQDTANHLQDGNIGAAAESGGKTIVSGATTVGKVFCLGFCLRAYTDLELSVVDHPNASLIAGYILMQGPPLDQKMEARHVHSLVASAYDHSDDDMASAYNTFQPHKNLHLDWGTWRSDHIHSLTEHHMDFMYQKHMMKHKASASKRTMLQSKRTRQMRKSA